MIFPIEAIGPLMAGDHLRHPALGFANHFLRNVLHRLAGPTREPIGNVVRRRLRPGREAFVQEEKTLGRKEIGDGPGQFSATAFSPPATAG